MSQLKTKVLKTALILSVITGSVMLVKSQDFDAVSATHTATQTIETKSENLAVLVGDTVDPVRKSWQRFDADAKVRKIQHKTRPIGQKIQSSVNIDNVPGVKAVTWSEHHMSLPAILLFLVFGGWAVVTKTG